MKENNLDDNFFTDLTAKEYDALINLNIRKGAKPAPCPNSVAGCPVRSYPRFLSIHQPYCLYPHVSLNTVKGRILSKSIKAKFCLFNNSFTKISYKIRRTDDNIIKLVADVVPFKLHKLSVLNYKLRISIGSSVIVFEKLRTGKVISLTKEVSKLLLDKRNFDYKIWII